ncbi:MAG: hypothetical protein ACJ8EY_11015 [Sphingomicrobium sp.]
MRRILMGAALLLSAAATAEAADYKLEFAQGQGKVLRGRGGLQVYDVTTDKTRMRIVAPGNRITKRGTVRVLVMNLGTQRYEFGPEEVSVELPDGTALAEVPFSAFDQGERLITSEVGINRSVDMAVKSSLTQYAQQQNSGLTAGNVSGGKLSNESPTANTGKVDDFADSVPGVKLLDGINGVLRPLAVGPKEAWGGYLIFDMPKALQKAKVDQPVTIVVKTGGEVHRINAVLNRI